MNPIRLQTLRTKLVHVELPPQAQVESGAGKKIARQACIVEIHADDGTVGIGSASGPFDLGALDRILHHGIEPLLADADLSDIPAIHDRVYHGEILRNVGRSGIGPAALSAVDVALWDLKARRANLPLYQLLGGAFHQQGVRSYASSVYWGVDSRNALEQVEDLTQSGWTAIKFKVGKAPRDEIAALSSVRASNPDLVILADANQSIDRRTARWLLDGLEDVGCYWFEEPLPVDDVVGHRELRSTRRQTLIATGENIANVSVFRDLITAEAVDVVQADATRVGGLTVARRVAELASAWGVSWCPHTFNDIITVATNLHLAVSTSHEAMFEWDVTANPLMTELAVNGPTVSSSYATPGPGFGLGITINESFVAGHKWSGESAILCGAAPRSG